MNHISQRSIVQVSVQALFLATSLIYTKMPQSQPQDFSRIRFKRKQFKQQHRTAALLQL
jgi:hypothetical protein